MENNIEQNYRAYWNNLIGYIFHNVYDYQKEEIEEKMYAVLCVSYKFPFEKNIYTLSDNNPLLILTPEFFHNYFTNKKHTFSGDVVYKLFSVCVENYYKKRYVDVLVMRINHCQGTNFSFINDVFLKFENTVLIHKDAMNSTEHVPLTHHSLEYLFNTILKIPCDNPNYIKQLLKELRVYKDFLMFPKKKYNNFIISYTGQCIKKDLSTFTVEKTFSDQDLQILHSYNFPFYPKEFIAKKADFSSDEQIILGSFLNADPNHLIYLSKLIAAAYSWNMPIKVPTVFLCNNLDEMNASLKFLNNIFNRAFCKLEDNEYQNPYENLDSLASKLFGKNVALYINLQTKPNDMSTLGKFVRGNYISHKNVALKNNHPIVIFTCDYKVSDELVNKLRANVINITNFCKVFSDMPLVAEQYDQIRQALLLYGLALFNHTTPNIKTTDYNQTLMENFYNEFIIEDPDKYFSKKELRALFEKYIEKTNPDLSLKPIVICNYLMEQNYNVRLKKRLSPSSHPVAVIKGISFDYKKFEEYKNGSFIFHPKDNLNLSKILDCLQSVDLHEPIPFFKSSCETFDTKIIKTPQS